MKSEPDLNRISLVVPCFNEAARFDRDSWSQLAKTPGIALTFVDDGSSDRTLHIVSELAEATNQTVLVNRTNRGKAESVRLGLKSLLNDSDGLSPVGFIDADGAFGLPDILRFRRIAREHFANGFDAVWSSRVALSGRSVHRLASRHYVGRGVATVLSRAYPRLPYDSQSGFKLFQPSDSLSAVLESPFRTRWLFEVELLLRWQHQTGRHMQIWEEPVLAWADVPGSKIKGTEVLRIARELGTVLAISQRNST